MPVVAILPTSSWIRCGMALMLALIALQGFQRLRSTTLGAPCLWAMVSAICLALGTVLEVRLGGISLSALQFAIAATTLCPMMAVLGARRPQQRGWQWIVLTLWIVLVWPAAQAVMLPTGVRVELFVAWKLFLWGLIAIGLLNYLPTRHWRAAVLVAIGQIVLLQEHLGFAAPQTPEWIPLVAVACFLAAATTVVAPTRAIDTPTLDSRLSTLDSQWVTFRNNFGAFWALRILGQMNQTATLRDWPLQLHWTGFVTSADETISEAQLTEVQQSMTGQLRRFVAQEEKVSDTFSSTFSSSG